MSKTLEELSKMNDKELIKMLEDEHLKIDNAHITIGAIKAEIFRRDPDINRRDLKCNHEEDHIPRGFTKKFVRGIRCEVK